MRHSLKALLVAGTLLFTSQTQRWGFFAHQRINHLAVFTLPPEMVGFYKKNISFITEAAVNPDRRRFFSADEAPRHYIDIDHYGENAFDTVPHYWKDAVDRFSEDTLKAYGIVPWHINAMYYRLRDAFSIGDPDLILRLSAEAGHYIADSHVPLHTTENYNGQLTGQDGIHGFWESRLPELYVHDYDFLTGRASYIENIQQASWDAVRDSHAAVDSVLTQEKALSLRFGEKKYSFEEKGRQVMRVYASDYAAAYHRILDGMVERRMRASIRMIGSFWYTAWVDAGQPDLKKLMRYRPSPEQIRQNKLELERWKQRNVMARPHE